ncbi:hypothetical protein MTO96_005547 [Rhipicephalus appendiculatus]
MDLGHPPGCEERFGRPPSSRCAKPIVNAGLFSFVGEAHPPLTSHHVCSSKIENRQHAKGIKIQHRDGQESHVRLTLSISSQLRGYRNTADPDQGHSSSPTFQRQAEITVWNGDAITKILERIREHQKDVRFFNRHE